MMNKILIVCIGNVCRSPMAEALLQARVKKAHLSVTVSSAGIAALAGKPADAFAQEILLAQGIDCTMHRARQLTSAMLLENDLVLVMDQSQRRQIEYTFPSACGKVHCLGKWGEFSIPDPYRKSKEYFQEIYQLIVQGIDQWQARLWT